MTAPTTTRKTVEQFDVPAECISQAKVVITARGTWHIYGGMNCHSFDVVAMPLPEGIKAPIIDISLIDPEADEEIADVIGKYIPEGHVKDVTALIEGLVKLGATVKNVEPDGSDNTLAGELQEAGFGAFGPM